MYDIDEARKTDPELTGALLKELARQRNNIELIASENFVSKAVLTVTGSWLTNKYAEGYPGKRFYGGCENVDIVETLAIERVKKLFGAEHANVQPHSGAQANTAAYFSILSPGDTIMGMDLAHGGHLSHGSPANISGQFFNVVSYGVSAETHRIDYDEALKIAKKHKPKVIVAGASAYPRFIDFDRFADIAEEVGAYFMVDMAHIAGLVAAGEHPDPVPRAHFVTSTTHKTLRGPRGGFILCKNEYAKQIDKAVFPGTQGGPLMHVIAAKAVAFHEALTVEFKQYARQIIKNAKALADGLLANGFNLVSGGTDNHLMLIDLQNIDITGKEAERRLDSVGITCNKNAIPFDTRGAFVTSGIRIGSPAVTTRGMKEDAMLEIADIITMTLKNYDEARNEAVERVKTLNGKYPLYYAADDNG